MSSCCGDDASFKPRRRVLHPFAANEAVKLASVALEITAAQLVAGV